MITINLFPWLRTNFTNITSDVGDWFSEHLLDIFITILIGFIISKIGSKIIFIIVRFIVRAAHAHDWHKKDIEKRSCTLSSLASTVWKCLVIIIVVVTVSERIFPSVSFSAIIASLGVVGVAIGFGSQSLVRDFLSGIFIITENQYRVGDIVDINGALGKVERVGTRSTTLRDLDGSVHFIPNGSITRVINRTMDYSGVFFDIRVHYDSNIDKAIEIINRVGKELADDKDWKSHIIEAPKVERISDFTGNAVIITILGKTTPSDQWDLASEMRTRLIREFKKAKINITTVPTPHARVSN